MGELGNFYLDSMRGRTSAEVFHGTLCVYSLLERKIADYLRPHDLTPVKFNALMLIQYKGGGDGLNQNEISRHMIVNPSSITRLLDRMEKDGLIQRTASIEDRRVNLIKITKKGSGIIKKLTYGYGETVQETVYLLEKSEAKQLSALLLKWFSKIERVS